MGDAGEKLGKARRFDRALVVTGIIGALLLAGAVVITVLTLSDDSVPTSGPSMKPTLRGYQELDIDFDAYDHSDPQFGDIIAAEPPSRRVRIRSAGIST